MNKSGLQYWLNGRLCFPEPTDGERAGARIDGSYRTLFGPCVAHNGVVYGNNNTNVSLATMRITKVRNPLFAGYEQLMQCQQSQFLINNKTLFEYIAGEYEPYFHDYTTMLLEAEEHHADPHPKKDLRIQSWQEMLDTNGLHATCWHTPNRGHVYKMKKDEVGKCGKIPRLICDLGVACSLQGFRITSFMKKAMALCPIEVGDGLIEFIPTPDPATLEYVFGELIEPSDRFYMPVFSDDSCLALRKPNGEILRYNIDIASCDSSHTSELFFALRDLFPPHLRDEVEQLIAQCRESFTILDMYNKKRKVVLEPTGPRLYSGSTLTTILNNLANFCIGIAIAQHPDIQSADDIISAAFRAGYEVTCQDCSDWHQLQFLKHSPVRCTDGVVRPLLNIGVLLRLSGTCKGDLPGTKDVSLRERARTFQASLLRGAYPHANFLLLDNMRKQAGLGDELCDKHVRKILEYKVVEGDYPDFHVPSHEVWARYGLSALEVAELELDFGNCSFEEHYFSDGTNKILDADYDLSGREYNEHDFVSRDSIRAHIVADGREPLTKR